MMIYTDRQKKEHAALSRQANSILGYGKPWLRKKKKKKSKHKTHKRELDKFFYTREWKELRYKVLKRDNGRCQLCGRSSHDGNIMNVDHIKPRRKYPHLAMDMNNLQTLCSSCNWGKGYKDETNWLLDQEYKAIMENS